MDLISKHSSVLEIIIDHLGFKSEEIVTLIVRAGMNLLESSISNTLPWVDRFARETGIVSDSSKLETISEALADMDSTLITQLTTKIEDFFETGAFAQQTENAIKKVKSKYTCASCKLNVWGRAYLQLRCDECNLALIES